MTHSAGTPRRGDIQGLRAIAVILVVVYHAGFGSSGGFVGVDVFFVISGYVITGVLLRELDGHGTVDLRSFYLRRMRRLLPALGLVLAIVMAFGSLLSPPGGQQMTSRTGVAAAAFNANTYLMHLEPGYFDADIELNALLHTWSLSVEEQFYLGFPFLILGAWHLGRRASRLTSRQAVTLGLVGVAGASLALSLFIVYLSGRGSSLAFYLAPARAWEFVAGALLAVRRDLIAAATRRIPVILAVGGALLVGWASLTYDTTTVFPGVAVVVPVAGTAMLIAAGEGSGRNPISRALAWSPAQWLGDRSYGWYLWHWPAIVYAGAIFPEASWAPAAAGLGSLGLAALMHDLVEQPIRHRPSVPARANVRLAALCILVPIVAAFGLEGAHRAFDGMGHMDEFAAHADQTLGCDSAVPLGDRGPDTCVWEVDDPAGVAVLIGDSQAGQLIEGFAAATKELRYTAIAASLSSCPFVDLMVTRSGEPERNRGCRDFVEESTSDLIDLSPTVVVIASAPDKYLAEAFDIAEPDDAATAITSPDDREAAWTRGLERTISALEDAGIDVAVIHPIPKYPGWDPRACATGLWIVSEERCGRSLPATELRNALESATRAEQSAVRQTDSRSIDLFGELCGGDECSTASDDGWLMRDGGHISVLASERLAPRLRQLIEGTPPGS